MDGETGRIDMLVETIQQAIDRLKELRTALISAAVTGRIDVRVPASSQKGNSCVGNEQGTNQIQSLKGLIPRGLPRCRESPALSDTPLLAAG